jgi:DNA-directed RNA polymerase specialized sigma24 family protein
VTEEQLRKAEEKFKRDYAAAERSREKRNALVLSALEAGWTHQRVSDVTGLSRGRISQIVGGARAA